MRKFLSILLCMALILGISSVASATYFYEEYSGYESMKEGEFAYFKFDMWYENEFWFPDNTNLKLTKDAEGAFGDWDSAAVKIDFYSQDFDPEAAIIKIWAYGYWGAFDKELVAVDAISGYLGPDETLYSYVYNFDSEDLALFSNYGWGEVNIKAAWEIDGVLNDFGVKKVAMGVSVPEPGTIVLMGLGLVGLAGMGRKKLFKK